MLRSVVRNEPPVPSLTEPGTVVEQMERGELSLEQSLKDFEKGISLVRICQQALTEAEQKVEIVTQVGSEPFALATVETEGANA